MMLLVVIFAFPVWVCAKQAIWGIPGASGGPEGVALARFAIGIGAVLFSLIEILFVAMLIRGIRRIWLHRSAQKIAGDEPVPSVSVSHDG